MIGYGSMLVESFTAVIALIAAITISQGVYFSTNMSASQISTASGVTLTATSTPDEQAEAAVKAVDSMKVSDIEGSQMKVTWDSVDENGNAKTYEGADALKQALPTLARTPSFPAPAAPPRSLWVWPTSSSPTSAVMTPWPSGTTSPSCSKRCSSSPPLTTHPRGPLSDW